jgi:hypothetical protein
MSYTNLTPEFYKTYQHESWQHPGSSEWSAANMPGWGNNPLLQGPPRVAMDGLGAVTGGNMTLIYLVIFAVVGIQIFKPELLK